MFLYFQAATSSTTTMKDAQNEIPEEVEVEVEEMEACSKLYHLLANVFVHDCELPGLDKLLNVITSNAPRKNYKGLMSLVHIFNTLLHDSLQLAHIALSSHGFESETLAVVFGPGDEFEKHHCPIEALVSFIIQENKLFSHSMVVHVSDFLHGVILYNRICAKRVHDVYALIIELDNYYYDRSAELHDHILNVRRSICDECVKADAFVSSVFDCYADIEDEKLLERGKIHDSSNQCKIVNALANFMLHYSDFDTDDDDDDATVVVSSSLDDDL